MIILLFQIKIWFQNRRARERREKCATITPPQAVTLPPTTMSQGAVISPNSFMRQSNDALSTPEDLSTSTLSLTSYYNHNGSFSDGSDDDRNTENRPETPLDIETVEDEI
uniref:Homeobox domain-containing protein n=1 Tax=Pectinophora gossypiella TaxID=13191 RepID=A0A1E1WQQ4_PECGO